jgi:hypothetical protein
MKHRSIAVLIACSLLASGAPALADSDDLHCSNRTVFGDYGSSSEGVLLGIPGQAEVQFRGLTLTHFDGRGKLTWLEHTVINGAPLNPGTPWTAASGTYTVNPNCTGMAVVNTPNSPVPLNLAFVIVKQGREIRTILDAHAIASVFIRVE